MCQIKGGKEGRKEGRKEGEVHVRYVCGEVCTR